MSEVLKKCAFPGCLELEDPRWGGRCDGHGLAKPEDAERLDEAIREQNVKYADLRMLLSRCATILGNMAKQETNVLGITSWSISHEPLRSDARNLLPLINRTLWPLSIVRQNAEKDPTYCPYCMRCKGLIRMKKIEHMYWRCFCGAEHDEREVR